MRTDDLVTGKIKTGSNSQRQPARRRILFKGLIALVGAVVISTATPSVAEAANAYIWIDRINGEYAVQGRNFPANSVGTVRARLGDLVGQKQFHTNANGYFWVTFYRFTPEYYGNASAIAWKDDVWRTATKYLPPSNTGSTTTTTAAPTTTTVKPATTTTQKPATTTTTAYGGAGSIPTTTTKPPTTTAPTTGTGFNNTPTGWRLLEADDFNGTTVNESKWGIYEGVGNQGHGWRSRSAVSVANGELRITGKGDTAGGVALKSVQTYGKYEIRAKTDKGNGYGHAILLWPASERWPLDGELDISEVPNGSRDYSGSFTHYTAYNKVIAHRENGDFSQWHTYGAEWEPGKVTYFLDGRAIQTVTTSGAVPTTPHFLGIQLDVGAAGAFIPPRDSSTPASVTMHVDYVKVYKR